LPYRAALSRSSNFSTGGISGSRKKPRKHPGRQELPADLPRVEQIIACTPQQCVCGNCGKERTLIDYENADQLDVEPAKYFVRVTKREKRACKGCEEGGSVAHRSRSASSRKASEVTEW